MLILILNGLGVVGGSVVAFFGFHGSKDGARALHLVKDVGVLEAFYDLFVYCDSFVPFLSFDVLSSLLKPINNIRIVKSKGDLSNLDIVILWPVNSLIWEVI